MKRKLAMMLLMTLVTLTTWAQSAISGTVVSEVDGEPVIGATVKVKGASQGVVTDLNGQFTINVQSGKTLVISYVGMKTAEQTAKNGMKIMLSTDDKMLDEVMVVAFGTQKKSSFTGSAATVSSDAISKHVATNVANTLAGSVPGLQIRGASGAPGASQGSIYIRGIASLNASTDPLIIVDGAPYSASLSNIPTQDIENVTVLKDAASAALYGARGAAGVILITTKKGNTQSAKITVDAKWGAVSRAVQRYDVITDPGEYYEAMYSERYNYYRYNNGLGVDDANLKANSLMLNQLGYNIYTVPEGQQLVGTDGKLNPNATLGRKYTGENGTTYYLTNDDWDDAAYRTSFRQEYNVSASGGSDKATFFASAGYLNEDGILQHSGYERFTGRIKADYQAKKWLKLGANAFFEHSKTLSNPNLSSSSSNETNPAYFTTFIAPIYPIYIRTVDANGNINIATEPNTGGKLYDLNRSSDNSYYGLTRAFLTGNPLGANDYNKSTAIGNQFNGTFTADVMFTDWLKLNLQSNVVLGQTNGNYYDTMFYGPKVSVGGELQVTSTTATRTNNIQTLNFYKDFGKHGISALAGHEYYRTETKYLSGTSQGLFTEDVLELDAAAKKTDSSSYTTIYNVEGFFGSAQYNYDEKYFASASYRRDASSRFAKEHRWGNFWSVGGAWIISKENFMAPASSWIDQLKLKASYGQQGNDGIGNYQYYDLYALATSGEYTMSTTFNQKGNDNITWETLGNFNVGLEFSLWRGLLSGSLDYYAKKTTNMLFSINVPLSSGYSSYMGNVGSITNRGFEVVLNSKLISTKDLDLNLSFNAAHNRTKWNEIDESRTKANGGYVYSSGSSARWFTEGGSFYTKFLPAYAGVNENGEALYWVDSEIGHNTAKPGVNKDYTTTNWNEASYYVIEENYPDLVGGFSINLRYRNFDLTANFDYQVGGKIYDVQYATFMSPDVDESNGYTVHKDYIKSWSYDNTTSNIPRWQYNDEYTCSTSDRFLTNAGYLNFQSFTVGYSLPKSLLRKSPFSNVRFYVAGENLCFWSARQGLDPRYGFNTGASMTAYNQATRNITGGVQVTF